MSKAENTKQFIIEKTAAVFNKKGYSGTSLSDLTKITGLTKGSIYGNFESKEEVAVAVYEYNINALNKRIGEYIRQEKSPRGKLKAFTEYYRINWKSIFERGGCPIQNASIEADDNLHFLKKTVQASITNWVNSIADIIEAGQEEGEFFKKIDAKEYAYMIITILEGGIMLSKIMNNQNILFSALDRIDSLIKTEIRK